MEQKGKWTREKNDQVVKINVTGSERNVVNRQSNLHRVALINCT